MSESTQQPTEDKFRRDEDPLAVLAEHRDLVEKVAQKDEYELLSERAEKVLAVLDQEDYDS